MIPKQIKLTGIVYIKYVHLVVHPQIGDILLLLNDDATNLIKGDYDDMKSSGYIKAQIFDRYIWQNIRINELCTGRENRFTKRQRAIDSARLCQNIIMTYRDTTVYRTYRGHFTIEKYEKATYNRKANNSKK